MDIWRAKNQEDTEAHIPVVYMQNQPEDMEEYMGEFLDKAEVITLMQGESVESAKKEIYDGTADLLVVFRKGLSALYSRIPKG